MDRTSVGIAVDLEEHEVVRVVGVHCHVELEATLFGLECAVGVLPERVQELGPALGLDQEVHEQNDARIAHQKGGLIGATIST